MSFFLLAPVTLLLEGVKFTPSAMQAMGIMNSSEIIKKTLLAGLCFHAYQQVHACISAIVHEVTRPVDVAVLLMPCIASCAYWTEACIAAAMF